MKQQLSAGVVWIIVGVAVVIAAVVIYFGAIRSGIGPGPLVKAKPWSPSGYGKTARGGGQVGAQTRGWSPYGGAPGAMHGGGAPTQRPGAGSASSGAQSSPGGSN